MNVGQLIEKLKQCPQHARVVLRDEETFFVQVRSVEPLPVKSRSNRCTEIDREFIESEENPEEVAILIDGF